MAKQTTTKTGTTALKPRTARKATAAVARSPAPVQPTPEQIRARAYEIFLRRNGGPGDAHDDWLQAERELYNELNP